MIEYESGDVRKVVRSRWLVNPKNLASVFWRRTKGEKRMKRRVSLISYPSCPSNLHAESFSLQLYITGFDLTKWISLTIRNLLSIKQTLRSFPNDSNSVARPPT